MSISLNTQVSGNAFQIDPNLKPLPSQKYNILKNQIIEIGKTDPEKASLLSRKIVLWNGTQKSLDELKKEGLEVSYLVVNRLHGGGLEDLIIKAISKGLEILIHGNKKEMEAQLDPGRVLISEMVLPGLGVEKGDYTGSRKVILKEKHLFKDKYSLCATGKGKFVSKTVNYSGEFFDNVFHDLTGKATYHIGHKLKYTGGFENGSRHGIGTLDLYHANNWYQAFKGEWKQDKPWQGSAKTVDGIEISVEEGHFCAPKQNNLEEESKSQDLQPTNIKQTDEKIAEQNGPVDGLNLEAICKEENNKYLILPIGKGTYDLGDLLYKGPSKVQEIEKLFFKNCTYSIEAHKKNKEILNISNETVTELRIDVSDFLKAKITTK